MNNESNYLNDKSNNDYQLIKEISEVLRDYKNKNKSIDRKFVDKVLNILLINNNIEVNKTKFVSNGYGSYDFVNKTIKSLRFPIFFLFLHTQNSAIMAKRYLDPKADRY